MEPVIDHLQVTVRDMAVAVPFYDQLLPLLGFDLQNKTDAVVEKHDMHVVEYIHPRLAIAISSPRQAFIDDTVHRRKPGALHHLAFKADSRAEVDRLHLALVDIGANVIDGPRLFPEHGTSYYAVFFKDPDGIKYEIVYDESGTAP